MKRNYESVIILNKNTKQDELDKIIDKMKNILSSNNGTMEKIEYMGIKKLAYEIQGQKEANYIILYFNVNGKETEQRETIAELERNYRIIDEIMKFIVVKMEE